MCYSPEQAQGFNCQGVELNEQGKFYNLPILNRAVAQTISDQTRPSLALPPGTLRVKTVTRILVMIFPHKPEANWSQSVWVPYACRSLHWLASPQLHCCSSSEAINMLCQCSFGKLWPALESGNETRKVPDRWSKDCFHTNTFKGSSSRRVSAGESPEARAQRQGKDKWWNHRSDTDIWWVLKMKMKCFVIEWVVLQHQLELTSLDHYAMSLNKTPHTSYSQMFSRCSWK